ncbi:tRNA U34 5-methylaminomethyl-2-thiouridine-forming methyltransferase MnmC [Stigmatella aurantiaca]|uniref:tRNA U34 5-methylaminomethyl-2-thiouridine-forming methyltransferase MnmC n=1 Tax=Stigmatella aurantiaca TaxID=41 RepID=A0A1H8ABR9_STIAU|nr:MnmC family methyltransferase [Stigmatella aurantiaca]SEM68322.1 tRNA U34 5-methylaminomethyl-2-thiouridine-forming methyltransferase MnmC [Stigmatella aurantiaca]
MSSDNPRDGDFELVTLRNGARAVRHLGHGEVMHPSVGPWKEALRLYVEQPRLAERLGQPGPPLVVLDVGLGAATNAVAALTCARELGAGRRRALELISLEVDLAPLRLALADPEGFPFLQPFREAAEALMRDGSWSEAGLHWRLLLGDAVPHLEGALPPADLVYFDPFSPASNPDMWTEAVLARVRARCQEEGEGARLLTYSAATPTRVTLLLAGFYVGAGVSTGTKGETTVAATRLEALEAPLGGRWLERWRRSSSRAPHGAPLTPEVESRLLAHPQWRSR